MAQRLNLAPQSPRRRENLDMTGPSSRYTIKFSPLDKEALHSELIKTPINLFRNIPRSLQSSSEASISENDKETDTIVDKDGHIIENPRVTNKRLKC